MTLQFEQQATAKNNAGGDAYINSPEHVFAKLITTGMMSDTFYAKARDVNNQLVDYAKQVRPEFLARSIVYARHNALMRDNPIMLLALLSTIDVKLFRQIFRKVILNGEDVLKLGLVLDSGTYRKGLGSAPRKELAALFNELDPYQFIKNKSANQRPSLKDLVRMAHPKPNNTERDHLFRWVLDLKGEEHGWCIREVPDKIQRLEHFKKLKSDKNYYNEDHTEDILATGWIPENVATSYRLTKREWAALAANMSYGSMLHNIRKMAASGIFEDKEALDSVCKRLSNEEAVTRARILPYKLMLAYFQTEQQVPQVIKDALGTALGHSLRNIPDFGDKRVRIYIDVSASMRYQMGGRSAARYVDVACMLASAILKKNPNVSITGFDVRLWEGVKLDANDTIFTNTFKLTAQGGGGTNVSLPFAHVLDRGLAATTDVLIAITDNESWFSPAHAPFPRNKERCTEAAHLWNKITEINPAIQGFMMNLTPYETDQTPEELQNLTMVSGFSDEVFKVMGQVLSGGVASQVDAIAETEI